MASKAQLDAVRRLLAMADLIEPRLRRQIEKSLIGVQSSISAARIEELLRSANVISLDRLLANVTKQIDPAARLLESVFAGGMNIGADLLPSDVRIDMRFNSKNLPAQLAAKRTAAKLVTNVAEETRAAIRELVTRGFRNGVPPRELAKQIKPLIGLNRQQARAVENYRTGLVASGLSRTAAIARTGRYAERLLRLRAETIARTEVIRASTEGQIATWKQAVGQGLLSSKAEKVWITTADDRLCRFCSALDGVHVQLEGTFRSLRGRVAGPPLHPNCRCAIAIDPDGSGPKAGDTKREPAGTKALFDTMQAFTRPDGSWAPRRQRLHDRIVAKSLRGIPKKKDPTFYMLGGGPASGKSTMLSAGAVKVPSHTRAVHVDPDGMKAQLPEFERFKRLDASQAASLVHEESSYLSKRVGSEAGSSGRDVVFDSTGDGTIEKLEAQVNRYRIFGHKVVANYATVDTDAAVARAFARGKQTGRYVPETYIRENHKQVSVVFQQALERNLFDEANLFDTNNDATGPRLVLSFKREQGLVIHDQGLWEAFKAKGR